MSAFIQPSKCQKCKDMVWELLFVEKIGKKYIHWCRNCVLKKLIKKLKKQANRIDSKGYPFAVVEYGNWRSYWNEKEKDFTTKQSEEWESLEDWLFCLISDVSGSDPSDGLMDTEMKTLKKLLAKERQRVVKDILKQFTLPKGAEDQIIWISELEIWLSKKYLPQGGGGKK